MIGVVGKLKICYSVSGNSFEEIADPSEKAVISLKQCASVVFRIEEVNYIEDTIYGAVLSLLEPQYLEDAYIIGSGATEFAVDSLKVNGTISLLY